MSASARKKRYFSTSKASTLVLLSKYFNTARIAAQAGGRVQAREKGGKYFSTSQQLSTSKLVLKYWKSRQMPRAGARLHEDECQCANEEGLAY